MAVEYFSFGALVLTALVATFVGMRHRQKGSAADPSSVMPIIGEGPFDSHHAYQASSSHDSGSSQGNDSFSPDGSGSSGDGGSHGGHRH